MTHDQDPESYHIIHDYSHAGSQCMYLSPNKSQTFNQTSDSHLMIEPAVGVG